MIPEEDKQEFGPAGNTGIAAGPALNFKIGDRIYFLSRSRDGNAWRIVANGDCVEHASILHYGDVEAFCMMAGRLKQIEAKWTLLQ